MNNPMAFPFSAFLSLRVGGYIDFPIIRLFFFSLFFQPPRSVVHSVFYRSMLALSHRPPAYSSD